MDTTDAASEKHATPARRPRKWTRRRLAAAARHSVAYRERQRAKGMPTGSDIDAMIARVFVQNMMRHEGLRTGARDLPKLCELVARRFDIAEEMEEELERRVALRVERLRAAHATE
ncbi:hypothetical protein [Aureimonas leprariae]|uniref:Uncharacterized protein n=1 Tax=Plantimonas leprariae TaxID=2615207 RepID=A0A7V7TVD2_9HYPH|nr:hypothetical protein [Aureimonas leprariae]KAB0678040.1 hypothetical protein F6X38_16570 [Aureimonas leprariae]